MLFIFVGIKENENLENFSDPYKLKRGKTYVGKIQDNILYLEGINGEFNPDWFLQKFTYVDYLIGTEVPTVGNSSYIAESPVDGGGMLSIKLATITGVNKIDQNLYLVKEYLSNILYIVKVV